MRFKESSKSIIFYMGSSFTSHFMALQNIGELLRENPQKIDTTLIFLLEKILKYKKHDKQKLASILYREAANLLKEIAVNITDKNLKRKSLCILKKFSHNILNRSSYPASFSLGTLPLDIKGPNVDTSFLKDTIYHISKEELLNKLGVYNLKGLIKGRSILFLSNRCRNITVFKFAKNNDDIKNLLTEIKWIFHLKKLKLSKLFSIPEPIDIKGHFVFSSSEYKPPFICFIVPREYFIYPNGLGLKEHVSNQEFLEILEKNSFLLGKLMSQGIIHTSVIPLFHNRTQRNRRSDGGVYLWERGGRLDRWLESSLYPNIGASGIRDFEHLISYNESNRRLFFREMGNQILSLILIIGSFFRMKDPNRIGRSKDGKVVDARDLFSKQVMKRAISLCVKGYFQGFVGKKLNCIPFEHMDFFVEQLINEMGVDRYMEEIIRVEDQKKMSNSEFKNILLSYGYSENDVKNIKKGERDITIYSGPHLGEFNRQISIPELIEFVAATTALIISSKYIDDLSKELKI